MGVDQNTSTLPWSLIASIVCDWMNDAIRTRNSTFRTAFCKALWGIVGFKVWVNVLRNRPTKLGFPDLVKDYMFYSVVGYSTYSQLSTKGGGAEKFLNSLFHLVWDCHRRVCNFGFDFIGDQL